MTRPRRASLWSWVALVVLPIACQWPDLSGWLSSDPSAVLAGLSTHYWTGDPLLLGRPWADDAVGTILQPLGGLAARLWLSGEVPWWNHFSGVGMPLAGEMQPAAFLLPFNLLLLLPHGTVLLKIAMQIVAGGGAWVLLRELRTGRLAALVGAILFETNGTFALFGDAPMLPIAFLPWLVLGIERARAAPGGVRCGWILIAVSVAASLAAGFPETAYFDGLLATAWAGVHLIQDRSRTRLIGRLAVGVVVGLALAGPVLLAFVQLLAHGYVGDHLSPTAPLHPDDVATLLFPYFGGPPYADVMAGQLDRYHWAHIGGYVSCATAFVATAALRPGCPALRWVLAGWIALMLACAAGQPLIRAAIETIPLTRFADLGRYSTASCEFAACLLAAFAVDDAARGVSRRTAIVILAIVWLAVGIAAAGVLRDGAGWLAGRPDLAAFPPLSAGWGLAGVVLAAGMLLSRHAGRASALGALLSVDAMLLFVVPTFCGLPDTTVRAGIVPFVRERIGLHRAYSFGPISPNYGARFGIATLDHTYLPVPRLWTDYIEQRLDPGANKILFNGVSNAPGSPVDNHVEALATRLDAFRGAGVSMVLAYSGHAIFGAHAAPPRVYDDGLVAAYALPDPAPYYDTGGACAATPHDWRRVTLTCATATTLIRRELSFPGWRATVNGHATPVGTAAEIFESVAVPAGVSDIRFRFAPPGIAWAWAAMAAGILALVWSLITPRRPRSRPGAATSSRPASP